MEEYGITDRDAFLAHSMNFDLDDNGYLKKAEFVERQRPSSEASEEEDDAEAAVEEVAEEVAEESTEEDNVEEESTKQKKRVVQSVVLQMRMMQPLVLLATIPLSDSKR